MFSGATPSENITVYFGAIPGGPPGAFNATVSGQVVGVADPMTVNRRLAA